MKDLTESVQVSAQFDNTHSKDDAMELMDEHIRSNFDVHSVFRRTISDRSHNDFYIVSIEANITVPNE